MKQYLYPQNLKSSSNLWLWSLRDFAIMSIAALLSVLALVQLGWIVPAVATLLFGYLSIPTEEVRLLDYILYAARFCFTGQQYFEWR